MFFMGKDDGPSIEEFIKYQKSLWQEKWKDCLHCGFKDDIAI
jgi:hypothetical protein